MNDSESLNHTKWDAIRAVIGLAPRDDPVITNAPMIAQR